MTILAILSLGVIFQCIKQVPIVKFLQPSVIEKERYNKRKQRPLSWRQQGKYIKIASKINAVSNSVFAKIQCYLIKRKENEGKSSL